MFLQSFNVFKLPSIITANVFQLISSFVCVAMLHNSINRKQGVSLLFSIELTLSKMTFQTFMNHHRFCVITSRCTIAR